jgi:hypothetical protein
VEGGLVAKGRQVCIVLVDGGENGGCHRESPELERDLGGEASRHCSARPKAADYRSLDSFPAGCPQTVSPL